MRLELMRKTDLALRALRRLEREDQPVHATDLAQAVGCTRQFMPQVLSPTIRAGWVKSVPGPRGGYLLTADLRHRSLLDLIELIEGPTDSGSCVVGGRCRAESGCAAHDAWSDARQGLLDRLGATAISSAPGHEHSEERRHE